MSYVSPPIMNLEAEVRQSSLLQVLVPSNETLPLSHFIEYFDGDVLDSIWDQNNIVGTGTYAMVDAIDEGFRVAVDAINPQVSSIIAGNSERHFDPASSIIKSVQRRQSAQGTVQWGLANRTDGDLGNTIDESAVFQDVSTLTFMRGSTINGLNQTSTNTSVAVNTNFHHTTIDLSASNVKFFIDGILEVTITTDLPDPSDELYAGFKVSTFAVAVAEGRIRYLEVFNK